MSSVDGKNDMSGFVHSAIHSYGRDGHNEMEAWPPEKVRDSSPSPPFTQKLTPVPGPPEKVPVITTLAKEFVLFDRFFSSHPGSTYPNRQFVLSATAHGMTDTGNEVPCPPVPSSSPTAL
jgi:hypothetical protein